MGIDPEKLFVVFVIALLVLGPERLPQAARALGRGLAHIRRYTALVKAEVDDVLAEPRAIIHSAAQEVELERNAVANAVASPAAASAATSPEATPVPADYRPAAEPGGFSGAPDDPSLN